MNLVETPVYYAGGGFPWGFLIIAAVLYLLWQKGLFDSAPRRPGPGFGPRGDDGGFGGPRERFEQWHREAHGAAPVQTPAQPPASAPAAPQATASADASAQTRPDFSAETPRGEGGGPALERW